MSNDLKFLCSEYERLGFKYSRERLEYLVEAYHDLISAYEATKHDTYERSHVRAQAMEMFQTFDCHVMNPGYIEQVKDDTPAKDRCGHFYGAFLHFVEFVSPYNGELTFREWLKGSALRPGEGLRTCITPDGAMQTTSRAILRY